MFYSTILVARACYWCSHA